MAQVPAAVNLGPNFTYHEREVLPTTTRAGRKLLHHKACWVYRQACLAPERSVVVLSLYVVNSTRRFPNLPQNPLWQEVLHGLHLGVDYLVLQNEGFNQQHCAAALAQWEALERANGQNANRPGRVWIMPDPAHCKAHATLTYDLAAQKQRLVDRIEAEKQNPGQQQQHPWSAVFLLTGAHVLLHWGNVNYSESSMSHEGATGVYGKNSMLHDAMWLTSGRIGSAAMMVAQSMLWGVGLCGRPGTLQQYPLIVMAAGDRVATLSGLHMARGIIQGVGPGDQLVLSFWVLYPMMGVDIAQEAINAFTRQGAGGHFVLLADRRSMFAGGRRNAAWRILMGVLQHMIMQQAAGLPCATFALGTNRIAAHTHHPFFVLRCCPANVALGHFGAWSQSPGQAGCLQLLNYAWQFRPGDTQWQSTCDYVMRLLANPSGEFASGSRDVISFIDRHQALVECGALPPAMRALCRQMARAREAARVVARQPEVSAVLQEVAAEALALSARLADMAVGLRDMAAGDEQWWEDQLQHLQEPDVDDGANEPDACVV